MTDSPLDSLYSYDRLSKLTGMSAHALSVRLHRARARRAEGTACDSDIPEPDDTFAGSPVWREATVLAWLTARAAAPNTVIRLDPQETIRQQRPVVLESTPTS